MAPISFKELVGAMVIRQKGFTIVELLYVIFIMGVMAAVGFNYYQKYVVRQTRTGMEADLSQIAQKLAAYKLANNDYGATNGTAGYATNPLTNPAIYGATVYPISGTAYYNLTITASPTTTWTIVATPISTTRQSADGVLAINEQGWTCWNNTKLGQSQNQCATGPVPTATSTWVASH